MDDSATRWPQLAMRSSSETARKVADASIGAYSPIEYNTMVNKCRVCQ